MNKLVSKNPVQRFKEGKKIIKAQHGWGTYKGVPNQQSNYMYRQDYPYDTPLPGGMYLDNNTGNIFSTRINNDNEYSPISSPKVIQNGTYYETKDASGQIIDRGRYFGGKKHSLPIGSSSSNKQNNSQLSSKENSKPVSTKSSKTIKKSKPIVKASTPTTVFAGHKIGRTGGLNYNIDNADRQQLIRTGQFTDSDFTNAISAQKALNRYFANSGLGSVTEDGAWGDQSRAALALALSKSRSLTPNNNETIVVKTPIIPTYTTPINQEVANLNLNVPTYFNANRSQTRDWMRTNNINPYSVSGATRAAIRRIRAGQADDNDKLLVKGNEQLYNLLKGYYKQGGLISRNPVKRFKQRNFRLVAQ